MTKIAFVLPGLILLGATAGCTSQPLLRIENRPVPVNLDGSMRSLEEVRSAVISGCKRRGWIPVMESEQQVRCTIALRGRHDAAILIPFSETTFSILHESSNGLDYNARRQKIHRNYNRWVSNLALTIVQEVGRQ